MGTHEVCTPVKLPKKQKQTKNLDDEFPGCCFFGFFFFFSLPVYNLSE